MQNEGKYYDYSTKNKSFLEMSKFLKMAGVKNNVFMLELKNPSLVGVDPLHPKSECECKDVIRECKENIWYFLREVVRIPNVVSTVPPTRFKLNPISLVIAYCYDTNTNLYLNGCRGGYATTSIAIGNIWNGNKLSCSYKNGKSAEARLFVVKQREIRDLLPDYLREKYLYKETPLHTNIYQDTELDSDKENQEILYEKLKKSMVSFIELGKEYSELFMINSAISPYPLTNIALLTLSNYYSMDWLELFDKDIDKVWFVHIEINADRLGMNEIEKEERLRIFNNNKEVFDREYMLIRPINNLFIESL